MNDAWLKPIFITLAIFMVIVLLMQGLPQAFPDVSWSEINPTVIEVMPWLVVLGMAILALVYIMGRK